MKILRHFWLQVSPWDLKYLKYWQGSLTATMKILHKFLLQVSPLDLKTLPRATVILIVTKLIVYKWEGKHSSPTRFQIVKIMSNTKQLTQLSALYGDWEKELPWLKQTLKMQINRFQSIQMTWKSSVLWTIINIILTKPFPTDWAILVTCICCMTS